MYIRDFINKVAEKVNYKRRLNQADYAFLEKLLSEYLVKLTMPKPFEPNSRTVCVDWNGVLDMYTGWREGKVYPPRPGALPFLYELKRLGYRVVVLSSQSPIFIKNWLKKNGMLEYVDEVTDRKVPAIVYIDDRAIRFDGDFGLLLQAVQTFEPFWDNLKE